MKKTSIIVIAVMLMTLLLAVPATSYALPSNLAGTVAFDFNNITSVTYGSGTENMFHDKISPSAFDEVSVVSFEGGKAVQFKSQAGYDSTFILRDVYGGRSETDKWPTDTTPKGMFFRIKNTGDELMFRLAPNMDLKEGMFKKASDGSAATGSFRCFLGNDAEGICLVETNGTVHPFEDVVDGVGPNAQIFIPSGFDGYFVWEFDYMHVEGLKESCIEADGSAITDPYNVPISQLAWWSNYFRWSFYFDTGVYEGTEFILDDYGYLTGSMPEAPVPSPSKAPSAAPSVAPSTAPSKAPSVAPSTTPSVVPSKAPSVAPSENPSDTLQAFTGTPKIDGVLDGMYTVGGNAVAEVGPAFYAHNGANTIDSDASGISYFLHDATNLYICTIVNDETPLSFVQRANDASWINDAVEYHLNKSAFAPQHFSVASDGTAFVGAASGATAAVKATATGYVVEVAIPLAAGTTEVGVAVQVNDLIEEAGNASKVVAFGSQDASTLTIELSATVAAVPNASVEPSIEPSAEATTASPAPIESEQPTDAKGPNVGLIASIVVAALVIIADVVVFFVIRNKKKENN